jgi:hypothetical protein
VRMLRVIGVRSRITQTMSNGLRRSTTAPESARWSLNTVTVARPSSPDQSASERSHVRWIELDKAGDLLIGAFHVHHADSGSELEEEVSGRQGIGSSHHSVSEVCVVVPMERATAATTEHSKIFFTGV